MSNATADAACPCGSGRALTNCCLPLLTGDSSDTEAIRCEQLMRSRYSAYALGFYDYVLSTYATETRPSLTAQQLRNENRQTQWHRLVVTAASHNSVDFSAYYSEPSAMGSASRTLFLLSEHSRFIQEDGRWRYYDGDIKAESGPIKLGRNEPCFCASGKKFKRCCGARF
ncbi:SEC-C domain-containing protein [Alteromonas sp. SM 2104]|nr:SEC-C domain-containing protein [Alteromonas oceanisediminis]